MGRVTTPQQLDERFRTAVGGLAAPDVSRDPQEPVREGTRLTGAQALELFDAQLTSRHLDLAARWLRSFGEGFYTIGSAGHEGNAAVAAAYGPPTRRCCTTARAAFYCARAGQAEAADPIRDVLRGLVAASTEPIAGGRHKVFGHPELRGHPDHLDHRLAPAAGGRAGLRDRARRGANRRPGGPRPGGARCRPRTWPEDADRGLLLRRRLGQPRHAPRPRSTRPAGSTTPACRLPLLFVCEDNGIGISVRSPEGWVAATLRPGRACATSAPTAATCPPRTTPPPRRPTGSARERRPAVLHLDMVRLMGHAGADAEVGYRSPAEIAADLDRDPLVATATLLVHAGLMTPDELLARYDQVGWEVRRVAEQVLAEPKLTTRRRGRRAARPAPAGPGGPGRRRGRRRRARSQPRPGRGLRRPAAREGGPADAGPDHQRDPDRRARRQPGRDGVRRGRGGQGRRLRGHQGPAGPLRRRPGLRHAARRDLDPGPGGRRRPGRAAARTGDPVPGLPAQRRGPAARRGGLDAVLLLRARTATRWWSGWPGWRTRRGSAGTSTTTTRWPCCATFRGWWWACRRARPRRRRCCAPAWPRPRWTARSACSWSRSRSTTPATCTGPTTTGWLAPYAAPEDWDRDHITIGRARVYGEGEHLTIVTFGNGVRMSLRVAARLAERGLGVRVVDLRWLCPLPAADVVREAGATGRVLIVDETRRSGGVGEGVLAALVDAGYVGAVRRVSAVDSYIPLGNAAKHLLVSEEMIDEGAHSLLGA